MSTLSTDMPGNKSSDYTFSGSGMTASSLLQISHELLSLGAFKTPAKSPAVQTSIRPILLMRRVLNVIQRQRWMVSYPWQGA